MDNGHQKPVINKFTNTLNKGWFPAFVKKRPWSIQLHKNSSFTHMRPVQFGVQVTGRGGMTPFIPYFRSRSLDTFIEHLICMSTVFPTALHPVA